ncbi:MAG: EamA/RhaT family transporter, partial [Bacteroidia bacterium]|nr:EamA/RhaT family transporter [Methylotenera sp.]
MHVNEPRPTANNILLNNSSLLLAAVCWGVVWYPYRIMADAGVAAVAASFYSYSTVLVLAGIVSFKHWRGIFNLPLSIFWLCLTAGWTNLAYV